MNTITVIGRKWFERTNGNTYHSVEVYKNGELIERVPFTYGYGSQWEQTAVEVLLKNGVYSSEYKPLRILVEDDNGDNLVRSVTQVTRKKDL